MERDVLDSIFLRKRKRCRVLKEMEGVTMEKKICDFLESVEGELGAIGSEIGSLNENINESLVRITEKLGKLEQSFESIALSLEGILAHMPSRKNSSKD